MNTHNDFSCDSSNCSSCYSNALSAAGKRRQLFRQPSVMDAVTRPWASDTHLASLPHRTDVQRPQTAACQPSSECGSPSTEGTAPLDDAWAIAGSAVQHQQQQESLVQQGHACVPCGTYCQQSGFNLTPPHSNARCGPQEPCQFLPPAHAGSICIPRWQAAPYLGLLPWQYVPSYQQCMDPVPSALTSLVNFQSPTVRGRRDLICAVEFSDNGALLAAGSVGKQVQLYGVSEACACSQSGQPPTAPLASHRMPSKLSCLTWAPQSESLLTTGDYDGVIYQLDINTGHFVADIDEHAGKRVLAVAHSRANPRLAASASEDGTVRLWEGPTLSHASVTIITAPCVPGFRAAACSVSFAHDDANLLVVGSADSNAYLYDLRRTDVPLIALRGHSRAVSYVRFMHARSAVTAAVDGALAVWDLSMQPSSVNGQLCISTPLKNFTGHTNHRNFVGLSVEPTSQLMACGSEDGQIFTYCTAWSQPLASYPVVQGPMDYSGAAKATSSTSTTSGSLGSVSRVGSYQRLAELGSNSGAVAQPGMQGMHHGPTGGSVVSFGDMAVPSSAGHHDKGSPMGGEFVSAVCWRPQLSGGAPRAPVLAAATSSGAISMLQLGLITAAA